MSEIGKFEKSTPKSKQLYDRAVKVMPGGNTRTVVFYPPYPAYAARGKGSHIWDVDGNERIDYCFNFSVLLLGHAHPKVMDAVKAQLENGSVLGAPTEAEVRLAEKVCEIVPAAERVRFVVTGTEATMNAIRVAKAYTKKPKIILFNGAYHGTSDPVVVEGSSYTSEGIPQSVKEEVIMVPFNDAATFENTLKQYKNETAAVLVEPLQGSGGAIPPEKGFLETIREETEKHGVILIFDEVQTGFRLARGGGQELFKVIPDMVALGKGMTGGFPGGAVGGKREIMEKIYGFPDVSIPPASKPRVPLSGTFNAHPISMAAGLAHLNELKPEVYNHLNRMGQSMRDGFSKICRDLGIACQVTGLGSFFQMHFTKTPIRRHEDTKYADKRLLWYLDICLLNKGIYFAPCHTSYVSAVTTEKDVQTTLDAIQQVLTNAKPMIRDMAPGLMV